MQYRIYVPVCGYYVYTVEAADMDAAVELVVDGGVSHSSELFAPEAECDTKLWSVQPDNT